MSKLYFISAILLVLLIVAIRMNPSPASARFSNSNEQQQQQGLQESRPGEHNTLAMELISFDHVRSPFFRPNLTTKERALRALQKSHLRAQSLTGKPVGKGKKFSSPLVYSNQSDYGDYLMEITIGTPPRKFSAVVDITTDLTTITCQGCEKCDNESDIRFNASASSTYTQVRCKDPICLSILNSPNVNTLSVLCPVNGTDGECNLSIRGYPGFDDVLPAADGVLSKETLSLNSTNGSTSTFPGFYFRCGDDGVEALVGLGQGRLSLVGQLGDQIGNIFSYCLVDWETSLNKTSPLLLGTAGAATLPLEYTPLLTNIYNPNYYYVNVLGITVGDKAVNYIPGNFDSNEDGAWTVGLDPFTQMNSDVYDSFLHEIRSATSYTKVPSNDSDLCYNISGIVSTPEFPNVTFHLQDVNVTLPYQNVFFPVDESQVCIAMASTDDQMSLGRIWQQNFQIVFDRGNKKLGIASTDCSLSGYH